MFSSVRPVVFWGPVSVLLITVALSLWNMDALFAAANSANSWILTHFSGLFNWGTFAFVLTCVWAALSPLGRVRIGGDEAVPLLAPWNWFSITLCTTIAIGILFWATAEPIFHLSGPPEGRGIDAGTGEAADFAVASLFMHWSFTPYAIYSVPALAFALAYYNLGKDYSLSAVISVVTGGRMPTWLTDLIDALALFSLIAGIAASLGVGMMSIASGLSTVLSVEPGAGMQAGVVVAVVGAFVVSSVTGLQRGIKFLSDINIRFFFGLCLFVLAFGPTLFIVEQGARGLVQYAVEFLPRSLGLADDQSWQQVWTVFYWANWLAWAPITALFLGRISRGYTVRQFILVNFFLPSVFAIVWMSIFGGAALHIDLTEAGALSETLQASGPEAIAYSVFDRYPFAGFLVAVFVFVSFISYVTAADSNTEAMAGVCQTTPEDHDAEAVDKAPTSRWVKITLAVLIGAASYVLIAFSGIDGVRMLSNLGGLPALFIVLCANVALLILGTRLRAKL